MCRQDSQVHLSAEEERAAEESLCTYCKPVELYNILQRRAVRNVMPISLTSPYVQFNGDKGHPAITTIAFSFLFFKDFLSGVFCMIIFTLFYS